MWEKSKNFRRLWTSLFVVGSSLYLGLWLLGLRLPNALNGIGAIAALVVGISILILMDQQVSEPEEKGNRITWAKLGYLLLTRRRPLLALLVLVVLGIALTSYYLFSSIFTVEHTGSGLVVRLPGHTVHYVPIHPYGWQSTGILLQEGQSFEVEVSGRVSPGHLQSIPKRAAYLEELVKWTTNPKGNPPAEPKHAAWPFMGPEGYPSDLYPELKKHGIYPYDDYKADMGLTVKGLPHNFVVGVILDGQETPRVATAGKEGKPGIPGYDLDRDKDTLLFLSPSKDEKKYPICRKAKRDGYLWVTINDADEFRWDNSGLFFLKLIMR